MKLSQHGDFDPSLLDRARQAMSFRFSEADEYSFATCERPDGSRYGTGGQCRKGTETTSKQDLPKESKVQSEKYSWGTLMKVSAGPRGSSYSAILHPEHQDAIRNLKDGDKTTIKDEQGNTWSAVRDGDRVSLKSGSQKLSVLHSRFSKEAADSAPAAQAGHKMPGLRVKRALPEVSSGAAQMYIRSGQRQLEDAKANNDRAGMAAALRRIKSAQKQLAEAKKREAEEAAKKRPFPAPKQPSVKEVGTAEQRMVLKRLEERLDNAVTVNEQQRISNAIKELQARMG